MGVSIGERLEKPSSYTSVVPKTVPAAAQNLEPKFKHSNL